MNRAPFIGFELYRFLRNYLPTILKSSLIVEPIFDSIQSYPYSDEVAPLLGECSYMNFEVARLPSCSLVVSVYDHVWTILFLVMRIKYNLTQIIYLNLV